MKTTRDVEERLGRELTDEEIDQIRTKVNERAKVYYQPSLLSLISPN